MGEIKINWNIKAPITYDKNQRYSERDKRASIQRDADEQGKERQLYLQSNISSKPHITSHPQTIQLNDAWNGFETTLEVTNLRIKHIYKVMTVQR